MTNNLDGNTLYLRLLSLYDKGRMDYSGLCKALRQFHTNMGRTYDAE